MTSIFGALRLPASVVFGSGQRAALGMMTAQIGKRALVCTDARMGGDAQFKAMVADIEANGVAVKVYDRTEADLPINGISACVEENASFKSRFRDAFDIEMQTWADAARRGTVDGPSAWDGYTVAVACAAGVEAMKSGRPVAVDLPETPSFYARPAA